jgi:hypothetical protein
MKIQEVGRLATRTAVGFLSAYVSLHALYSAYGVDFRANPLLTFLYCALPGLSFPAFFFVRTPRLESGLQAVLALGYLTTFSMLNWRTCAELGYCGSVTATVLETLRASPVSAAFSVVILDCTALLLKGRRRSAKDETRRTDAVVR